MEIKLNKKYNKLKHFKEERYYTFEEIMSVVEELEDENEHLKKQIEKIEQDRDENYRRISVSEQVGIDNREFI